MMVPDIWRWVLSNLAGRCCGEVPLFPAGDRGRILGDLYRDATGVKGGEEVDVAVFVPRFLGGEGSDGKVIDTMETPWVYWRCPLMEDPDTVFRWLEIPVDGKGAGGEKFLQRAIPLSNVEKTCRRRKNRYGLSVRWVFIPLRRCGLDIDDVFSSTESSISTG